MKNFKDLTNTEYMQMIKNVADKQRKEISEYNIQKGLPLTEEELEVAVQSFVRGFEKALKRTDDDKE